MGYYVHISVVMHADDHDGLAALATKYLPTVQDAYPTAAKFYLQDLTRRSGETPGPKGGLSMWGWVNNGSGADDFIELLMPFWHDVLVSARGEENIGPRSPDSHILVFQEGEESGHAEAFEIMLDPRPEYDHPDDQEYRVKVVQHSVLPFSWWGGEDWEQVRGRSDEHLRVMRTELTDLRDKIKRGESKSTEDIIGHIDYMLEWS